jgi:Mg2+ and Co2+ transporter CorA
MSNIVEFPITDKPSVSHRRRAVHRTRDRNGPNMHTFLFRKYDLIVESDEADLVRDVCFDIDKAEKKLKAIRRRLQDVQEQAAAQVQLLTAADTKLTAAIVAALLSTRGQR